MRVAINTRFLLKDKLEGIGWYTKELCERMVYNHPEVEFLYLFDRPYDPSFLISENITPIVKSPPARHPVLWKMWFDYALPTVFKKFQPDVFWSPDGFLSLKTKVPTNVTIHDIAFEHYPNDLKKSHRKYYLRYSNRFARQASRISTVSEYSKLDIATSYHVSSKKIDVIYNGVRSGFKPVNNQSRINIENQYTAGTPYFLFVGAMHPRKNIVRLLKAYEQYRLNTDQAVKLLMVGRPAWGTTEMETVYNNHKFKSDIVFTGRLSEDDLVEVTASALAQIYVPYFEGFGVPILEAQACETPVICSNTSSMPEASGGAALLVDPFSVESICHAMKEVSHSSFDRASLLKKGAENVSNYSWDKSAEDMWNSIIKTLY